MVSLGSRLATPSVPTERAETAGWLDAAFAIYLQEIWYGG